MKMYIITYSNMNTGWIDSIWSTPKLAKKRKKEIEEMLFKLYGGKSRTEREKGIVKLTVMEELDKFEIGEWIVDKATIKYGPSSIFGGGKNERKI